MTFRISFLVFLPSFLTLGCGDADSDPPPEGTGGSFMGTGGSFTGTGGSFTGTGGEPCRPEDVGERLEPTTEYFFEQLNLDSSRGVPTRFSVDGNGQVACSLFEVFQEETDCAASGRIDASSEQLESVRERLLTYGFCGDDGIACSDYRICAIPQLTGAPGQRCRSEPGASLTFESVGFCYTEDPESGVFEVCALSSAQAFRASGSGVPAENALVFLECNPDAK